MARHEILGGLVQVYKRGGRYWNCSASLEGKQFRTTTKQQDLEPAKRLRLHLRPFFGKLGISEVTPGKVQEYRVHRALQLTRQGKPPSRSTLHDEIVTLRLVLKTAVRHNWVAFLPDLSPPYKTQGKIEHRPWFTPEEYKQLYTATREYAKVARAQDKWRAEQVHDFVLFMANTGLRPDEAKNLQHRDVKVVQDRDTSQRILEIEVRGKRGVGFCKSMPGAVQPYQRLLKRATADSDIWLKDGVGGGLVSRPARQSPRRHFKNRENVRSVRRPI